MLPQSYYYRPGPELDECNRLIDEYWESGQYDKCFQGHLPLAEKGYPLAECQIGFFYTEGYGVEKDLEKAVYWTRRSAQHGDHDAQYNLGEFYENGTGVKKNLLKALYWYTQSALQQDEDAIEKCRQYGFW